MEHDGEVRHTRLLTGTLREPIGASVLTSSMPRPTTKQQLHARHAPASRLPLGSTVAAALEAASNTFGENAILPLAEEKPPLGGSLEGRKRLGGAFLIELTHIRPDPRQPRRTLDTEAQKELNDSVRRLGILRPITVRFIEPHVLRQRPSCTGESPVRDVAKCS